MEYQAEERQKLEKSFTNKDAHALLRIEEPQMLKLGTWQEAIFDHRPLYALRPTAKKEHNSMRLRRRLLQIGRFLNQMFL